MKTAIVTIVVGESTVKTWQAVGPSFLHYAETIGAELVVLDSPRMWMPSPHWLKFDLCGLLTRFDRIAYIDSDVLIRPDCPNLFDLVPTDKLGIFNEGKFEPRAMAIHELKVKLHEEFPKWDGTSYYNTGVMVLSRQHRRLFEKPDIIPKLRFAFGEQTFLNYRILKNEYPVYELNWRFNRMSLMNRILGTSRLDSYVVHYAGAQNNEARLEAMKRDLVAWWQDFRQDETCWKYEPCIFIDVGGGIGDQISTEPALRYLTTILAPRAEVKIMSVYPRIFQHLARPGYVEVASKYDAFTRDAIYRIKTHPGPDTPIRKYVSHHFTHGVDYAALTILRRTLPVAHRQPLFVTTAEEEAEVAGVDVDILIHPGRGWPINTFPVEWWNKVIHGLSARGLRLAIVGKDTSPEHGVLDFPCYVAAADFRNKLSLGGLMALIKKTPALLTNDSSPVHLAGCFSNHIFLIPTCKHPDHLLPFRCGQQDYRARAFYRKLLDDDFPMLPTEPEWKTTGNQTSPSDYLPDPGVVIDEIARRLQSDPSRPGLKTHALAEINAQGAIHGYAV